MTVDIYLPYDVRRGYETLTHTFTKTNWKQKLIVCLKNNNHNNSGDNKDNDNINNNHNKS